MIAYRDRLSPWDGLFLTVPLAVYGFTCAPGIGFGDTAILVDNIQRLLLNSQVNTHPLTTLLGHLFSKLPLENLAYKANLLSVWCGSLAVLFLYMAVLAALGNRFVALVAGSCFLFSHSMWWHSTIIENYAVGSALVGGTLTAFVGFWRTGKPAWLAAIFFLAGLGLFNHVQLGFLSAGAALTLLLVLRNAPRKGRLFAGCSLASLSGLFPWLILVGLDWRRSGNLALTLRNAFFGPFGDVFFSAGWWSGLRETAMVYLFQFPNFFLPFPLLGIPVAARVMKKSPAFWGILLFFGLNTVTFAFYETWDRFAFLLPSFMILCFFGAFAVNAFLGYLKTHAGPAIRYGLTGACLVTLVWTPRFYDHVWRKGRETGSYWNRNYHNQYSRNLYDQARFIIIPDKRDYRELDIFAGLLFDKLPPNAVYVDDDSRTYYTIADYFQKYYRKRPDVKVLLINSWGIAGWGYSSGHLADFMRAAYLADQPFFMASLMRPYGDVLGNLPPDSGIRFERFPLSDSRWIYRMKTRSEHAAGGAADPTRIRGEKGYVDFHLVRVVHQQQARVIQQIMAAFPGDWREDDQLFVDFTAPEGDIQLAIPSDRAGWARLRLFYTRAGDFGAVTMALNGRRLTTLDLHGPRVMRASMDVPETVRLAKGTNILRFSYAPGKSVSKGNKAGLDGLEYGLLKTENQE
ncbi:MAG: protein O-mannosyl-transferase family [Thermodesulfobacteriota bacterium]